MIIHTYFDEEKKKKCRNIIFFEKKRFNVVLSLFNKMWPYIVDSNSCNIFYEKGPFKLFKLLREAKYSNKHYGHVHNRPIDVNKDFK